MVDFAGWSMPVQYSSIIDEHHATRNAVGVFDVSHMGRFLFTDPAALDFLEQFGVELLRRRTHYLAKYAREQIRDLTGEDAPIPNDEKWYGSMIAMPVRKDGRSWVELRDSLRQEHLVEPAIYDAGDQRIVRTSCYLYNTKSDVDRLVEALRDLLY